MTEQKKTPANRQSPRTNTGGSSNHHAASGKKRSDKMPNKSGFDKKSFKPSRGNGAAQKSQFSHANPRPQSQQTRVKFDPQSLSNEEKALFLLDEDTAFDAPDAEKRPFNAAEKATNADNLVAGEEATQAPYIRRYNFQSADEDIQDFGLVNYLTVTRGQHDQRVDNFLLARLKGLPRSHIYQMIRSDEIRVNKKRCKPFDKLERGDIVRIAPVQLATREKPVISHNFAKGLLERVVYEDEGLIVLNKPAGMAVHGGSGEAFGVIEAMREVTGKKYLELVHRIDKDTSGLLMIAKKRSTLKKLQDYLREKTIQKSYLCIVRGTPKADEQLVDAPLLRYTLPSGERRVKVDTKSPDSKTSQTDIKVLHKIDINGQKATLLEAKPHTGRTHQIRVHMASIGHPILGDTKYFPVLTVKELAAQKDSGVTRLCLHAWKLEIPDYPLIITPLPHDLAKLLPSDIANELDDIAKLAIQK